MLYVLTQKISIFIVNRYALQLPHFKIYNKQDILSVTRIRRFETKIGERVQVVKDSVALESSLQKSSAPFVLVGIPEDIGVLANQGVGGCDSCWRCACSD